LDGKRIDVIYNGVAPDPEIDSSKRNQLRESFGTGPEDFLVGTAGRFDPVKNLPMLLKSISEARKRTASIRGLLVGGGPDFERVRKLRDDLRLSDTVAMPGHRDDARQLIQCMDLFVLSSFSEGTSMALLEAISAGVPVAVTDVGGNPEVVISGLTGWVVKSDSVRDLTNAIVEAVSNPQKTGHLADSARRRFNEKFTMEKMLTAYRNVYSEMMN
jgi:glycosyltransferase involved in cell wall biosynthesis